MIELVNSPPKTITDEPVYCDFCGKRCLSQIYEVKQERPRVTRTWRFHTLECLRRWASPLSHGG